MIWWEAGQRRRRDRVYGGCHWRSVVLLPRPNRAGPLEDHYQEGIRHQVELTISTFPAYVTLGTKLDNLRDYFGCGGLPRIDAEVGGEAERTRHSDGLGPGVNTDYFKALEPRSSGPTSADKA